MGAALVSFMGYAVAIGVFLLGCLGVFGSTRGWGDAEVSDGEYLWIGLGLMLGGAAIASGVAVVVRSIGG